MLFSHSVSGPQNFPLLVLLLCSPPLLSCPIPDCGAVWGYFSSSLEEKRQRVGIFSGFSFSLAITVLIKDLTLSFLAYGFTQLLWHLAAQLQSWLTLCQCHHFQSNQIISVSQRLWDWNVSLTKVLQCQNPAREVKYSIPFQLILTVSKHVLKGLHLTFYHNGDCFC
jgi:hypothetical protein